MDELTPNTEPIVLKSEKAFSEFKETVQNLELQVAILNELLQQLDKEQLNNISNLLLEIKVKNE